MAFMFTDQAAILQAAATLAAQELASDLRNDPQMHPNFAGYLLKVLNQMVESGIIPSSMMPGSP